MKKIELDEINEILAKVDNQPKEYSLGFRRLDSLPSRIRKNTNLACALRGEINDNSIKEFLNKLTEEEFINWLKIA